MYLETLSFFGFYYFLSFLFLARPLAFPFCLRVARGRCPLVTNMVITLVVIDACADNDRRFLLEALRRILLAHSWVALGPCPLVT